MLSSTHGFPSSIFTIVRASRGYSNAMTMSNSGQCSGPACSDFLLVLRLDSRSERPPRLFVCYSTKSASLINSRLASDNGDLCADNQTRSSPLYDLVSPLVGLWRQKFLGKPGRRQPVPPTNLGHWGRAKGQGYPHNTKSRFQISAW